DETPESLQQQAQVPQRGSNHLTAFPSEGVDSNWDRQLELGSALFEERASPPKWLRRRRRNSLYRFSRPNTRHHGSVQSPECVSLKNPTTSVHKSPLWDRKVENCDFFCLRSPSAQTR